MAGAVRAMVALVRFIDQRGRVDELRRDVDDLDRMVDPMFDEFKRGVTQ